MFYFILALIVISIIFTFIILSVNRKKEINTLKQKFRKLTFSSPKYADESLRLQIINLKNKFPGRSEKWYLEKVIYDLERDRRNLFSI